MPRLPLVHPTLGGPHFWMGRRAEGCRDRHISRLMLICGYHLRQGTFTRCIQCIPLRELLQYQSPASFTHPAEHSSSRGTAPTATAAITRCQQSMRMNHVSNCTTSSPQGPTELSNAYVPSAPPPVPRDVPSETAEPTIKKKRKRADARQLEALNGVYTRTAFPSTEERQQLARDLDMSARSVQIWLAHAFVFDIYVSEFSQVQEQKAGEPSGRTKSDQPSNQSSHRNTSSPHLPHPRFTRCFRCFLRLRAHLKRSSRSHNQVDRRFGHKRMCINRPLPFRAVT